MESDTDYFEDAQRVSSECCPSESPKRPRRCMETTPPLFSSHSDCETSSDGAFFPSDQPTESTSAVRFPSDDNQGQREGNGAVEDELDSDTEALPYAATCGSDSEREQVGSLLVSKCCHRQCLLHLTALDLLTARERYFSLKGNEQRQWLMDRLHENSHKKEQGKLLVKFSISGREICQMSWCRIYRISYRRLSRILKSVSSGSMVAEHGNKGRRKTNTKSDSAKAWMTKYFNLVGDKMPHNSQIHLPSWETQKDVHTRYTEDMTLQGMPALEIVSLSMFYKLWAEEFSNVVIPQVNIYIPCTFTLCCFGVSFKC